MWGDHMFSSMSTFVSSWVSLLYQGAQCSVRMGPELGPSTVGARYSGEKLDLKTPPLLFL